MKSDKQVLEAAIQRAIEGGWKPKTEIHYQDYEDFDVPFKGFHDYANSTFIALESVLFDHEFAKALWGEELIEEYLFASEGSYKYSEIQVAWKKHLQIMVVAPDPIAYLRDYLEKEND